MSLSLPVVLDRSVRLLDGGRVLLGGDPGRLVRLRRPVPVGDLAAGHGGVLADVLVDRGLAHPRPAARPAQDVVVVVPVRDRATELGRCLDAVGRQHPVLVVDDASVDPAAIALVCDQRGARLLRLPENVGPAGARNAGVAATEQPLVAFLDSDCVPPPGWLDALAAHTDDPRVAAVAPRVRALPRHGLLGRYAQARGPLDLGPREGLVRPGGRVPYVPTAALLVRRTALAGVEPFDARLRLGEDVDLVWRLHDVGWRVRYDPRAVVGHGEPSRWLPWLRRRHAYGTSAGPLAHRHPGRLAPLVLPPWSTVAWLLAAAGRPASAACLVAVPAARLYRPLRRAGAAPVEAAVAAGATAARAAVSVGQGLGGAGRVVTAPVLLSLLTVPRVRRAAAFLLVAPALLEHLDRRPAVDPVRWTMLRLVEDLAYASGVWRSAWTCRSTAVLRPRRSRPTP